MTPSNAYERFTKIVLSLLIVVWLLLVLSGCQKNSVRPATQPMPPWVICDAQPLSPIPVVPEWPEIDQWAVTMMQLYEIAAIRLQATNECLANLRNQGVIR